MHITPPYDRASAFHFNFSKTLIKIERCSIHSAVRMQRVGFNLLPLEWILLIFHSGSYNLKIRWSGKRIV